MITVSTLETLHEIHSRGGKGWHNTGNWQEKSFYADYTHCAGDDCYDGQTQVGPFEHYPGTPNFVGTTTWVEDNVQYVQANYSAVINECPEKVEYNLNSGTWTQITANLGTNTTSITIPPEQFIQGVNTIQFRDSNTYSMKFEWTLYMNQGATPQEYITSCAYDSYGNITSITDAEGHTKTYSYSATYQSAYLTSFTDALGNTTTVTYDLSTGLATTITNPNGNTSTYQYDLLGRVTRKINPDLSEKEAVYDDTNNCVTIYDELDHFIKKYYDGLDRLQRTEWYLNGQFYAAETYTYDYLNNMVTKTDPGGHVYQYEYDSRGRTTKMVNPDGTFSLIEYDDTLATVRFTDEKGHLKEYQSDWAQRLTAVKEYTDPVQYYLTQYTYDQEGNLTQSTNANGEVTTFTYGSLCGPTLTTYPDGTAQSFTYDKAGNVLTRSDSSGTTTYTYDAGYRTLKVQFPDQSTVQFTYDPQGNRSSMTSSASLITYTYDNRNRLVSTTQQIDGINYTFSYAYDAAGRLLSLTYPDNTVVTRVYDDLNRLTSIPNYADFTYSVDSLPESATYNNGVITSFTYDQCHRPSSVVAEKGQELLHLEYTYDPAGNITHMDNTWSDPLLEQHATSLSFGYDNLDRLTSAANGFGTLSFSYDPVGNRVQQILNGETTQYTYLPYDKLAAAGQYTFTYDLNGNTVSKTSSKDNWSYQYDTLNRLTGVQHNGQTLGTYVYNGDNQRIKKTEWNPDSQQYETIIYLYSQGDVHYEKNTTTTMDALYVYGSTGRIAKKVGEKVMYYHTDHLGSTRLLTDQTGTPATAVEYSPFGKEQSTGEKERYLFTGQEKDSTGLYYYRARYYDLETGRFLTRDTWAGEYKKPQTLNRYVYCLNNPLKYTDPSGKRAIHLDPDELAAQNIGQESTESDSEIDWYELGKVLGYFTGQQITSQFTSDPLGMNYQNCSETMKTNAKQLYKEIYGLEGEDLENFVKGFDETVEKGRLSLVEETDAVFANVEKEVYDLASEVSETVVKAMAEGLLSLPPELFPEVWALTESASAIEDLAIAIDNIPEPEIPSPKDKEDGTCSGTALLCISLLLVTILVKKKRQDAHPNTGKAFTRLFLRHFVVPVQRKLRQRGGVT